MAFLLFVSSRRRNTSGALVTGVQTCALPVSGFRRVVPHPRRIAPAGRLNRRATDGSTGHRCPATRVGQSRRQHREAHVPAQQPPTGQAPRLPSPDVRPRRPGGGPGPAPQGPPAPLRVAEPGSGPVVTLKDSEPPASPPPPPWPVTTSTTIP